MLRPLALASVPRSNGWNRRARSAGCNRRPFVVDVDRDTVLIAAGREADDARFRAVLKRVAEEVPDHLGQPIGIPRSALLALVDERALARRLSQEHFVEDLPGNLADARRASG